ncbi:MAG: UDP-N-acetyl-2-amino-2-deoxyglucuronate dehydrogenase [Pseudonocardiales bacterium]|nr:UDP-N-acetyl-2-amino-2-deoxyglucuronate dehydrogenase [Pseudonocardiales bacterium]
MNRLRVAVAGCGDIAAVHLDAILADPDVEPVGVCDVDAGRRDAAARRAGCPGFADLTALLDAVAPDVVHVCTPHDRHADLAAQCLARGVSVLLEKPVAHSLAAGERLAMAAEDSTAVLGVCFQNRYNDTARALRELLDGGALGRVLGGRASVHWFRDADYYARRDWRGRWATAGGGVLMNQAIHTLDLLQWYLGPVTDVRGTAATLALHGRIEVEDTAAMRLRHRTPDGEATSIFHASNNHVENAPVTVEIVTEHARARLETDLTVTYDDGRVDVVRAATAAAGERAYWGVSHALLIEDFYRHVRAGKHFWIDAPAALETLRIIDAVYDQSPGLNRPPPA